MYGAKKNTHKKCALLNINIRLLKTWLVFLSTFKETVSAHCGYFLASRATFTQWQQKQTLAFIKTVAKKD